MMTTDEISDILRPLADPARAVAMRAYLRHQFDFLGIATPQRRAVLRPLFKQLKGQDGNALLALATQLWQLPEREFQYAALDLLAMHWKALDASHLPQLLSLARSKSWWDTVDGVAALVGDVLRFQHDGMDAALQHGDFWMRRIALLHQLGWREKTDARRLAQYALALSHEKEFFIQKAIGWALRDYARHAPDFVRQFIQDHRQQLAPLSIREAMKHL
jgi:3-methyladenine DNA glycosylase AlkD